MKQDKAIYDWMQNIEKRLKKLEEQCIEDRLRDLEADLCRHLGGRDL